MNHSAPEAAPNPELQTIVEDAVAHGISIMAATNTSDLTPEAQAVVEAAVARAVALTASNPAGRSRAPKSFSLLQNVLVGVITTGVVATGGGIYNYNSKAATMQEQVTQLENDVRELKVVTAAQNAAVNNAFARMPSDYVPRMEHQGIDRLNDKRIDALEAAIDDLRYTAKARR